MAIMQKSAVNQQGIASLPVVLALLGLLIAVGLLISSISFSDNQTADNLSDSEKALQIAQLGARDGLEKIARNKNFSGNYTISVVNGGCNAPYDGCATVSVDSGNNPKVASSTGRLGSFIRKIKANVYLDSNGLITSFSWQEQ